MRISTFTRYVHTTGAQTLVTAIHLDCGHSMKYDGEPTDAERHLRDEGGTISRSGFTRCQPCTVSNAEALFQSLKEMGATL